MNEGEREYRLIAKNSECFDISAPNRLPYFSGSILYESTFKADTDFTVLDLGQVGEIAEVYLNDKYIGLQIKPVSSTSSIPEIYKEKGIQHNTHIEFTKKYGGKVFYLFSCKAGDKKIIANTEVIDEIKAEINLLSKDDKK
jgi:hypothetical protein